LEPLARVELSSDAPAEVIRLLPLVGLEPVSRISTTSPSGSNLADASLVAIRVDFAAPRTPAAKTTETGQNSGAPATIAIAFDSIPPLGTDLTADLVTDSAVAAVCFILSRILGLASAFLTTDPNLFDVIRAATAVARGPARILVEGELGVGKESLIKLIHAAGRGPSGLAASRERPGLVHAECAGLEADAVESEIAPLLSQVAEFNRSHSGNGGAIFFNRIGELPPAAQRKLLDLLRTFAGVAPDRRDPPSNVRILAASTRPLRAMVADGNLLPEFHDLFDATLTISPLRVRRGDLPLLVRHYLRGLNSSLTLNAAALRALSVYPFPGNALELVNFVTRVAIVPPPAPKHPHSGDSATAIVGRAEVISQLDCGSLSTVWRSRRQRDYRPDRARRNISVPPIEPRADPAMPAGPASLRVTTGAVPRLRKPRGGHHRPLA
jgi:hypothetical protein